MTITHSKPIDTLSGLSTAVSPCHSGKNAGRRPLTMDQTGYKAFRRPQSPPASRTRILLLASKAFTAIGLTPKCPAASSIATSE